MAAIFVPSYQIPDEIILRDRKAERARFQVIDGGRRPTSAFRRRRRKATFIGVIVLATLLTVAGSAALFRIVDSSSAVPSSAVPTVSGDAGSNGPELVVQQGDTLTSIARQLQPTGDTSALVSRLAALHGPSPLLAGERLDIASLGRSSR